MLWPHLVLRLLSSFIAILAECSDSNTTNLVLVLHWDTWRIIIFSRFSSLQVRRLPWACHSCIHSLPHKSVVDIKILHVPINFGRMTRNKRHVPCYVFILPVKVFPTRPKKRSTRHATRFPGSANVKVRLQKRRKISFDRGAPAV